MSRKLGGHSTTAQVHPGQFTNFFSKQFLDQANTDLKIGHAVGLEMSTSGTQSQTTQRLSGSKETHVLAIQSPKSVKVKTASGGEENVPADLVVLAAGPWTGSLALKLLGNKIGGKLGVSGSRAHSIVLKTKEELTAHCLFTSMSMADGSVGEPEVYARPDGESLALFASLIALTIRDNIYVSHLPLESRKTHSLTLFAVVEQETRNHCRRRQTWSNPRRRRSPNFTPRQRHSHPSSSPRTPRHKRSKLVSCPSPTGVARWSVRSRESRVSTSARGKCFQAAPLRLSSPASD